MIFQTFDPDPRYNNPWPDPALKRLVSSAVDRQDAKAMAFIAARLKDAPLSVQLADETVRVDPSMAWLYYVVSLRHASSTVAAKKWAQQLHEWDPDNAAAYLMTAEAIDIEKITRGELTSKSIPEDPEWRAAMAGALQARSFDDYLKRQLDSDRDVVHRLGWSDPMLFFEGFSFLRTPSYAAQDISRYLNPSQPDPRALFGFGHPRNSDSAVVRYLLENQNGKFTPESLPPMRIRVIQALGVLMAFFATMLLVWAILRRRRSAVGLVAGIGLLVSAVGLHFAYRPFARAFETFLASDDVSALYDLRVFHSFATPPVALMRSFSTPLLFVWTVVLILCIGILVWRGANLLRPNRSRVP